ncbi:hypothetical protein B0H63DRAFT_248250 [Podospora didyma]|uniref:Uncharacterized protein n=1 Tax=Podospora didyma TaxID=330526 RepID=A0AAE0KLS9_9PEZI|nr:hypothetical protein B0H63DRAFT_248250 [Podospora didyma]
MAVSVVTRGHHQWPPIVQPARSRRAELVLLREGLDVVVSYFNCDDREAIRVLTIKAKKWSEKYFQGYHYAAKRPTILLKAFPHLFDLSVQGHLRLALAPTPMTSPSPSEPEGTPVRVLRQLERRNMNSEEFPPFAEPTLASEDELDEIIDLRPRLPRSKGKTKPVMRVDAATLRGSGLLSTLPEFLGQLARANLETETLLANNPTGAGFELDETAAAEQPHIEMDLYAGLAETQRRRNARRIHLPGGRPFKLAGDAESSSGSIASSMDEDERDHVDASGDESDASTSTTASLRVNLRKRKSRSISSSRESSPANKIRIQYAHPPPTLAAYDMKRREVVMKANPAAGQDPFDALHSPTKSTASTSSSSSSTDGSKRIIKIKVPKSTSSSSASSSSQDNSRASTPESQQSQSPSESPRRIIRLKDPRSSPSAASSSSSSSGRASRSPVIKLRISNKSTSPTPPPTLRSFPSSNKEAVSSRPTSSGSDSSSSSGRFKIKLIHITEPSNENSNEQKPAKKRKLIFEEVE